MKFEIEKQVTSTVTETVNVESGYYRNRLIDSSYYYLRESGTLIHVNSCAVWVFSPDRPSYKSYIKEIIEGYQPCEQSEFEAAKDKVLRQLSHYVKFPEMTANVNPASGQSGVNHMFDPNTAQQGPANEEVIAEQVSAGEAVQAEVSNEAATESAAQDQAVEVDSEEGSIEG